jgi:hypothetical protein
LCPYSLIQDPDPGFVVNPNPDPDLSFDDQKLNLHIR